MAGAGRIDSTATPASSAEAETIRALRARLEEYQQLDRDRDRADRTRTVLLRISEAAHTASTVVELLATVHREISTLIDATNFYVALYNPDADIYSFPYCVDQYEEGLEFAPQQLSRSLTDYVRRTGKPLLADESVHQRLADESEVDLVGVPSRIWLGVPLRVGGDPIGVVVFQSYTEPGLYTESDLELVSLVSDHIAMVIQRKRAEESLRITQFSIEHTAEAAYWMGPDAKLVFVNETACRMLGYSRSELLKMTVHDIDPNFPVDVWSQHWDKLKKRGSFSIETCHRTKSGDMIPVEISINYMEYEGLEFNFAWAKDISERKHAVEELRERETRLRLLTEQLPAILWTTDTELRFTSSTGAGLAALGLTPGEVVGVSLFDFFRTDDPEFPAIDAHRCALDGASTTFEINWGEIDYHTYVEPLCDAEGEIVGTIGIALDITERKHADAAMSRAKRLETAGRLAGQIAHDFNNVLGPMVAYPEIIRMHLDADSPIHRMIDIIESCATQMAEINQQLLTLSRRGHYKAEPLNLNRVVADVLQTVERPDTIVTAQDLSDELLPVKGGGAQLHRVLANVVSNAIDALSGTGTIQVTTENVYLDRPLRRYNSVHMGEYVRVSVADDGMGIADDILDRVFDPFFSTKTATKLRGSGLGLSVVQSVVDDHNGYVDVDTAVGQGTTISIYLPVFRGGETTVQERSGVPRGAGERIMVVDDDPVQREVVQDLLKELGYTTESSSSGEEAVDRVKRRAPDVIILDMVMQGIDGAEALQRIRIDHPHIPVVLYSGFALNERVKAALSTGPTEFLAKPVKMQALAEVVCHLIGQSVPIDRQ